MVGGQQASFHYHWTYCSQLFQGRFSLKSMLGIGLNASRLRAKDLGWSGGRLKREGLLSARRSFSWSSISQWQHGTGDARRLRCERSLRSLGGAIWNTCGLEQKEYSSVFAQSTLASVKQVSKTQPTC